jgi:lysophospholipase L1-like esterase
MRPPRSLQRPLLALGSLIVSLVLAEALVRVFELGPEINPVYRENFRLSENPRLGYELVPGSRDIDDVINDDGMRDRAYPRAKPPGTFRIASLGDSICYGFGCRQSETYSTVLERSLNQRAAPATSYEVLNFGVTGYGMGQSVESLRSKALAYEPDLILFQYCLNDPMDYSREMEELFASVTRAEQTYWARRTALERRLLDYSRLYAVAAYALQSRGVGARRDVAREDPQWQSLRRGSWARFFSDLHSDEGTWQRIRDGFAELATLAEERPVMVVIFPILLDLEAYPLSHVHRKVAGEARRHGLAVLDLLQLYAGQADLSGSDFIYNALHPNPYGHRLAAEAILAALLRQGLLPPRTGAQDASSRSGPPSPSRWRQRISLRPSLSVFMQPKQLRHSDGRVSPWRQRRIRSGSRISGRAIETQSATPDATTSSITGRLRMPPTTDSGTDVARRTTRTSGTR